MGKKAASASRHSRGLKANEVTEIFAEALQGREDAIRSRHQWLVPMLDQMSSGKKITPVSKPGISDADYAHYVDMSAQVGVYRMWAKNGRVTYDLNDYLAQELYRSTYDKLPGNIFAHLSHINPLVVLPEPWPITLNSNEGLVRGFFVYGFNSNPDQQTFTNEDIEGLGLLMVIDLLDLDTGEVRGQAYMRLYIPTSLKEFTFEDAVQFAGERVEAMYIPDDPKQRSRVWNLIEEILRPALGILIYLCCDNRDAVEPQAVKPSTVKRGKKAPSDRNPFWVEIGWRIGPRLHAARRAAGRTAPGPGTPSGVQRAAHQRAGHFHKFRVGPGRPNQRTQFITRWLMPHWVGLGELPEDMDPITTVVAVDPQRHDPLRRRGLKARRPLHPKK
ncbi:hypothetical protein [Streptomyces sp. 5-10]|uniref:hypothetical protein n=1 Tax=Streptomyces sp. 5-10 TaxID=878925 RepID=UPI00168C0E06|nr:hypothetical protein [Streptomyces sp. 5-10]MBD3004903.1 hypothetical protein [Streptomyces sp. 5-10]